MRSTAETVGATDVMCDVLFPFILAAVEPRANQGSVCMGQGPLRLVDTHAHTHGSQSPLTSAAAAFSPRGAEKLATTGRRIRTRSAASALSSSYDTIRFYNRSEVKLSGGFH